MGSCQTVSVNESPDTRRVGTDPDDAVVDGLGVRGRLIAVGADTKPVQMSPLQLINANRSVVGHASGASIDSEDTLAFSVLSGVRPMIETMPLACTAEAYARMMQGRARFRMVLKMA